MPNLVIRRLHTGSHGTVGMVHTSDDGPVCFSLEDPEHAVKIAGDTAIPAGVYPLRWRQTGKWAGRFRDRLGVLGSLEVCDIPGFTDVLLHPGNTKRDTAGCILLGDAADLQVSSIWRSRIACERLYRWIDQQGGPWQIDIS